MGKDCLISQFHDEEFGTDVKENSARRQKIGKDDENIPKTLDLKGGQMKSWLIEFLP